LKDHNGRQRRVDSWFQGSVMMMMMMMNVTVYTVAAGGVLLPVEEVGDSVHDSTSSPAQTPDTEASGADAHSAI